MTNCSYSFKLTAKLHQLKNAKGLVVFICSRGLPLADLG